MEENKEIEELLKKSLEKDIEELEVIRKNLVVKANRLKLFILVLLLGFLPLIYYKLYGKYSAIEMNVVIGLFAVLVLLLYFTLTPATLVAEKNISEFYKKVRMQIIQKSIGLLDPKVQYSPIYKTHISKVHKSGIWSEQHKITKESDALIFDFGNIKASVSEMIIYKGAQRKFWGSFIKIDLINTDILTKADIAKHTESIKKRIEQDFKVSVKESIKDEAIYYAINFNKAICAVKLSSKQKISFDYLKENLLIIHSLLCLVNSIGNYSSHSVENETCVGITV